MTLGFRHSRTVIEQLARDGARTPPTDEDKSLQYVDRSLTILGRTFDVHNQRMRQEFFDQRDFIAGQFGAVDNRFEETKNNISGRFEEIENKIDQRFKGISQRFEEADRKMRHRLDHLQKASRNSLRTRGWEEIYPVGPFNDQGGVHAPKYFPHTVRRFWRLKDPSQIHRLIHLLRFYNIQGYEEWDMDVGSIDGGEFVDSDDSSGLSSRSSKLPVPLETAVQSNPEIAHRALAAQLGLVYDGVQKFMDRAQELNTIQAEENRKRRQNEETSADERRRRLRQVLEEDLTEVTTPTEPLQTSQ